MSGAIGFARICQDAEGKVPKISQVEGGGCAKLAIFWHTHYLIKGHVTVQVELQDTLEHGYRQRTPLNTHGWNLLVGEADLSLTINQNIVTY